MPWWLALILMIICLVVGAIVMLYYVGHKMFKDL